MNEISYICSICSETKSDKYIDCYRLLPLTVDQKHWDNRSRMQISSYIVKYMISFNIDHAPDDSHANVKLRRQIVGHFSFSLHGNMWKVICLKSSGSGSSRLALHEGGWHVVGSFTLTIFGGPRYITACSFNHNSNHFVLVTINI